MLDGHFGSQHQALLSRGKENMRRPQIVTGQKVSLERQERAVQLRREMTPAEQMLWQRLRAGRHGGLHFRRQQIIRGFFADFYCHAAALVVEVDGPIHAQRQEYDAERDALFRSLGLAVLRVSNAAVMEHLEDVLAEILVRCQNRMSGLEPVDGE